MEPNPKTQARKPLPVTRQLQVFFRDKWLCHVCRRPLVFPFAMRHLAQLVTASGVTEGMAYYNLNWRRDSAPLLDELAASIDHVRPLSKGGSDAMDNLAAICARCNARKSASTREAFIESSRPWRVKGKHGEPVAWDGLSSVFVALASRPAVTLTTVERKWLAELKAYFRRAAG